ncbi:hypothetical protein CDZ97_10160 [Mameliella alba]|uniref:hypothetical protein n=1 Tax=Mameliella alba TaxID=561184 RepID=UPI000B531A51|nr:hypothetical protein [Mameliella alba]OWV64244.1 hypothetical protein CDZ97_10160 [Mameliella alba]
MISSHHVEVGGKTYSLKLGTGAMMRLESTRGVSISKLLAQLQGDPGVRDFVAVMAEVMNDGAGATQEEAVELIDMLGFDAAGLAIGKASELAFPEAAQDDDASGNATGAGQAG